MFSPKFIIFALISVVYLKYNVISSKSDDPILIVVSFDAFKRSYLNENLTHFLTEFGRKGVRAANMGNCFPTKTFPNHFSIATGLNNSRSFLGQRDTQFQFIFFFFSGKYPGSHGVTGNEVYDQKLGLLQYGYDLFHYDKDITPIWRLNEMQGGRSGVMMWPGSDFKYKGEKCTFHEPLDKNANWLNRADKIISWLTHKTTPANFVMLYIEQPDEEGHAYSPDSKEVKKKFETIFLY